MIELINGSAIGASVDALRQQSTEVASRAVLGLSKARELLTVWEHYFQDLFGDLACGTTRTTTFITIGTEPSLISSDFGINPLTPPPNAASI